MHRALAVCALLTLSGCKTSAVPGDDGTHPCMTLSAFCAGFGPCPASWSADAATWCVSQPTTPHVDVQPACPAFPYDVVSFGGVDCIRVAIFEPDGGALVQVDTQCNLGPIMCGGSLPAPVPAAGNAPSLYATVTSPCPGTSVRCTDIGADGGSEQ
jgi:hypothetical protein